MHPSELAAILANRLAAGGSRIMFGVPGGGNNLEVIGAAETAGIRFVLAHGETAATIMAAVYADLTGTPTVSVVTRGPGAASAMNGAAQALLDRQPVVLVTDAVRSTDVRRISHQRLDQTDMFVTVTKWSSALAGADPENTIAAALAVAVAQPPGPVHLDFDTRPGAIVDPPSTARPLPRRADIDRAKALIERAVRPVVVLGVGARSACTEIRRLLAGTNVPVLTTYRAKGLVPDSWNNNAGIMTGATTEAPVLHASDLIVAIGLDTVELIPNPWPYAAPVVCLSGWPERSPYFDPAVEVVGVVSTLVEDLMGLLAGSWPQGYGSSRRLAELERLTEGPVPLHGLSPQDVVVQARAIAPPGTIATVDAGAHMLVAMPLWGTEERDEVLISSGLATMGFAVPAAIAAALAYPNRRIVCFVGDGGLGMVVAELETIARLELPISVVVFNDSSLSLIAVKQAPERQGGAAAVTYNDTDFALIAQGFGLPAVKVTSSEDLGQALRDSFGGAGPSLLDVRVDPAGYPAVMAAIRGARA